MTEMEVLCGWLDPDQESQYVMILREVDGERALPMTIGPHEARAIQWGLEGRTMERPLTHDLMAACVADLNAELDCVEILRFEDGAYFAELVLRQAGQEVRVDSRPSDAAALALRCDAPIYATTEVLEAANASLVERDGSFALIAGSHPHPEDGLPGEIADAEFRKLIGDLDLEDI